MATGGVAAYSQPISEGVRIRRSKQLQTGLVVQSRDFAHFLLRRVDPARGLDLNRFVKPIDDGCGFIRCKIFALGLLGEPDRKSTRLNSSHSQISYAVFCLKKKSIEACVYCTLDFVGYPCFPAPVEFISA